MELLVNKCFLMVAVVVMMRRRRTDFVTYFIIPCDCDENFQIWCCRWGGLLPGAGG